MSDAPLRVYVVAGEASGDLLGAGLMRGLKELTGGKVRFFGVGGEFMEAEGLKSIFPYHELSLLGIAEVLPHAMRIFARINLVVEDILTKRPDVVVTIDSPGFNYRAIKKLRKHHRRKVEGIKFVHYVAPSVWAYKPQRAGKCAKVFDHMLTILPFEPPYFIAEGLPSTFVGHPVAYQEKGEGKVFREKYEIAPDAPLVCMLPGSRLGEIKRHMPAFAQAIGALSTLHKDIAMVVPTKKRLLPLIAAYFTDCPFRAVLLADEDDKKHAIAAADAALVKSGTVALEVARAGVPHIVAYKTHPITAFVLRRILRVPHANLINILSKREVIPEFLQQLCRGDFLADAMAVMLADPAQKARRAQEVDNAFAALRTPDGTHPSLAAAKMVLQVVGR